MNNAAGSAPNRRRLLALGGLAGAAVSTSAAAQGKPLRIVLHVSEAGGWPRALSNARNLAQKYPALKVLVIADGDGIYGYQGSNDLVSLMATTAQAGVSYQACHNALDEKKIAPSSLPPFVKVVPSGVIALAEAQADGYAYIKP